MPAWPEMWKWPPETLFPRYPFNLTVDQFLNSSLIQAGGREVLLLPPVSGWPEILKLLDGQPFNSLTPISFFVINLVHSWQKIQCAKAKISRIGVESFFSFCLSPFTSYLPHLELLFWGKPGGGKSKSILVK